MPTILQDGSYTFMFFSSDKGEPAHIHVKHELNEIVRLVAKHEARLLEAWNDYFGT